MKKYKLRQTASTILAISLFTIGSSHAQVSKETLESITTPEKVETSIGTLNFMDGAPSPETAQKVYDYLDTMRGVDAFLKGMPGASMRAMMHGAHSIGAVEAHQVYLFDKMMDSRSLYLTANTSTVYCFPDVDLERDGPIVLEVPAGMLGGFNDAWFQYIEDIGPFGPDKGKGGKFLLLPPGYQGAVPDGYFVVRSGTYNVWIFLRASIAKGIDVAVKNVKDNFRIYPLSKKDNPPEMEFISASGKSFNTIGANTFKFYEDLNDVIQKEPLDMLDPETRGLFASIGIVKGKPFAPDARMKKILTDAVAIGNATARSIVWYPRTDGTMKGIEVYPGAEQRLEYGLFGQERLFQWRRRQDHEFRCTGVDVLSLYRCNAGYGSFDTWEGIRLRHGVPGFKETALRRIQDLQAQYSDECARERFLGGDHL